MKNNNDSQNSLKTSTLTIRISPEDKQLISDMAWQRRTSMAELIVYLVRKADKAEQKKRKSQESKE